ncbi:MAG: glycerol-3-phosphate acyltransferase [Ignavibacteria bacterium]|nr:glycerol-3-phosphate acyltransferase [Ignavibacteria bacterium]
MEFLVNSVLTFVLCYIIGSFPTAYVYVKLFSGRDVRKEGSGNVGTLNSFQVTRSKFIGIAVLITDFIKGFLPVYVMLFLIKLAFPPVMIGSIALIVGHNYPVWLKFKGGRGLATGAGIFAVVNFYVLLGWCIVWLIVFLLKRKVLISNTIATIGLVPIIVLITLADFQPVKKSVNEFSDFYFMLFSFFITMLILSKHKEVFSDKKK